MNNNDKSMAGSLKFMAPEVLSGKNTAADPRIDIFSLGVILFRIVTGKLPFDSLDNNVTRNKIISGIYSYPNIILKTLSVDCKDLIDRMLETNPSERITMK
jgi:serine/threonine protein kinase